MTNTNSFSLKQLNTFNIEAFAKEYQTYTQEEELLQILERVDFSGNKYFVLGGGSNVLFTKDFDGIILHPQNKGIEVVESTSDDVLVKVGAGEEWDDFVGWAVSRSLYGVENLSLIPGSVGAAPIQNIGAYGMEACQTIDSVRAVELHTGQVQMFQNAECNFGYRSSVFKKSLKGKYVIVEVFFRLKKYQALQTAYGNIQAELENYQKVNLKTLRKAIVDIRERKLPDTNELGNAGSFFKNPVVEKGIAEKLHMEYKGMPAYPVDETNTKLAAGWLIEQAGWKGKSHGRAGVHQNQALVLVNKGGATGQEVLDLANSIQASVMEKFGVVLEAEVNIL